MGWKKVALAGCLPAVGGGCHLAKLAGHNIVNEPLVVHTEKAIERGTRSDAKAAWQQVREQFPRRMFTADFRDGFVDGYSDYLAHGGSAQPPAVPPLKYTRNKKYYTPEGHCLIRDYYLGFKYGVDVAVATGQRKFLTVPVLLAEVPTGPPQFNVQPGGVEGIPPAGLPVPPEASKPEPLGAPKPLPAPPGGTGEVKPVDPKLVDPTPKLVDPPKKADLPPVKPTVPWESPATVPNVMPKADPPKVETPPKKADPPKDVGSKFGPSPTVNVGVPKVDPDTRLPAPNPPLPTIPTIPRPAVPTPVPDANPVRPTPPPLPKVNNPADPKGGAIKPVGFVALPEPPAEVPTLPDHLPTPSVLDELPVLPANHAVPDARPANHAVPPALPQP